MAKESLSLDRLLHTRNLNRIVPALQPEILHRVVKHFGLEQCGELLALASPAQIARVLDADIWHNRGAGADARFDGDRFGVWLAVLIESGVATAAQTVAGLGLDLVTCGLVEHIAVCDSAAVSAYVTLEGEYIEERVAVGDRVADIGGFRIETKDSPAWEAIIELLLFLDDGQPAYFRRLMRECVRLSNGGVEPDGFHDLLSDKSQQLFDVRQARDRRRSAAGYVTGPQAHAFLRDACNLRLDGPPPPHNPLASAYVREMRHDTIEPGAPIEPSQPRSASVGLDETHASEVAVAAVVDLLLDQGILGPEPHRLLASGDADPPRLELIRGHIAAQPSASDELAYLANVLLAGCRLQGRAFTPGEGSTAAASVCNLGLEHWPRHWSDVNLVVAFQVGWLVLHREVCMWAAQQLIAVLRQLHVRDRDLDVQLTDLRTRLARGISQGMPWHVREGLEVLLALDAAAWAGLLALIDECPVTNAVIRGSGPTHRIDLQQFEFISNRHDITAARLFLERLPDMLRP